MTSVRTTLLEKTWTNIIISLAKEVIKNINSGKITCPIFGNELKFEIPVDKKTIFIRYHGFIYAVKKITISSNTNKDCFSFCLVHKTCMNSVKLKPILIATQDFEQIWVGQPGSTF